MLAAVLAALTVAGPSWGHAGEYARHSSAKLDANTIALLDTALQLRAAGERALAEAEAAAADPAIEGEWSAPQAWPLVAVHAILQPNGKVLAIDGFGDAVNTQRLWDPATGTFTAVPYGRNLFCAGHILLADGRTLLLGGHIDAYEGLADATFFDSTTNSWARGADMAAARWYPTATQLGDGRVLVFAGDAIVQDRPGQTPPLTDASVDSLPELYDPESNAWTSLGGARLTSPLYPFMFLLSDGRVFDAGPDMTTRVLDVQTGTWSIVGTSPIDGGSAVMYAPDKIMKSGRWADVDFSGVNEYAADGRTAVIDMSAAPAVWRETAPMNFPRSYHTLTALPDGKVLAMGGSSRSDGVDLADSVLPAEIWDPETETWTTVASMLTGRLYHSTALLLPDGRVLATGGGAVNGGTDQESGEIYSPPYLFKGPRPTIASAPATMTYGTTFTVETPDSAQIASVSLIRSPSVTHAFDENQRFLRLDFTAQAGSLLVEAPANGNLAPPGDYMLFLVDTNGVPSVASFVRAAEPAVTSPPLPAGLVAAYSFDEGSGTSVSDLSGSGNQGTVSGASWVTGGKYGSALSFDGVNDLVNVADADSLDLTSEMTLMAWVNPSALGNAWRSVIFKEQPSNVVYALYGNRSGSSQVPLGEVLIGGTYHHAQATSGLPLGAWTHLAATYDGTALSLYVNGSAVATSLVSGSLAASTGALRIGGNNIWGEWFQGLIDEVRVYNRALSATEIQTDMNTSLGSPDTAPPTAPSALSASAGTSSVGLSWSASSDNVGVARYNVHRSTTSGFTPSSSNRVAQPTGTTYSDSGLAAGTYYYKVTAEDAAGNVSASSSEASAAVTGDTQSPSAPSGLTATAGSGSASLSWTAASDNVGVARYNVHRSTTSGFTPSTSNRIAQPTGTTYSDSGLASGTYYYKVTAEDAAGNVGAPSNEATAAVTSPPPLTGLVAAYSFDEGSGTAVSDLSGTGNTGTISGASWVLGGKYGSALSFDGVNDLVNVADADSLDLTSGMTLMAWVNPSALGNAWRSVVFKEQPSNVVYALYGNRSGSSQVPLGEIIVGGVYHHAQGSTGIPLSTWTHLATTYDGSALRLYVNGSLAATASLTGSMPTSTGALRIGGNTIWGEWFQGLIDEVRVYNRALSATQVQADMSTALVPPDSTAPSAPGSLSAAGGPTSAQLSWTASTDNVGVVRYNVHRATTSGFTPSSSNRVAQPAGTTYTDSGLASGTYYYKVTAQDAAGNVSGPSNEASALVGDTGAPSAPGALSATGGVGQVGLSWGAATDNVGVARYNVHRSATAGFTPSSSNRIAQPTGTTYGDSGLAAGTYYYKVTAEDAAGNVGPPSNEASAAATADTTAPSAPAGLTASVSGSTANLSWTASTDGVGVVRYNVHRATTAGFTPSSSNRIAQPTGTTYSDSGLAVGTYYYKVTAEDAAGNVSGPSAEATAAVADATAPTAPSGLTAAAAGTSIDLGWTAATDNVGVARYNVHRSTTSGFTPSSSNRVAQPTGTTYTDSALAAGTYYYKVTAEDAAGNVGPVSNTASASIADTTAPSAPSSLAATGGAGQAALSWTAATDNVGVARYNVHRSTASGFTPSSANRVAQPTGTTYTDTGLAAGTYYYKVTAEDGAGNVGPASNQASAVVQTGGLVAAYGFDEGSGTTTADQSGTGNPGTLSGPVWAPTGKYGRALTFDGVNDLVTVADSPSLGLTNGMTLEAWVRPTALGNAWRTTVMKERSGGMAYALYANGSGGSKVPVGEIYTSTFRFANGTTQLTANVWTHIATTYDGSVLALYVNGTQVSTLLTSGSIVASSGALRIGGNTIWSEWFQGDIDEVRIYNRALTATEIQGDMNRSITAPDTTPPSAPGTLSATGGLAHVALGWGAATDTVGVARYNVHRSTTSGFTPSSSNRIAQPTGTTYTDTGLAAGTYYYKVTAEDAAGNVGPASNEASGVAAADSTPPSVSITSPSAGATVSGTVTVSAGASDDGTVAGVQFRVDGANIGAEDTTSPYAVSWDTFTSLNGSHALTAVARDGAGNTTTSAPVSVTVENAGFPGLVGAWAFDEGSGTTTADQSGNNNTGTLANAVWTTAGKFNSALSFNGTNALVSVADSASLDLTTGMTIEAWLRPSAISSWRTAILKEQSGNLVYGVYANGNSDRPKVEAFLGGSFTVLDGTSQLPLNAWTHLAATYDGTAVRVFVNGSQVSQAAASGSITTSSGALRIGGNLVWGEYFSGLIDEVRIYNRALTATQIQSDMTRSITPDTRAPTVTGRTPAPDAAGVNVGTSPTVVFDEAMNAGSITTSTFVLRDAAGSAVAATVSYDAATATARLTPSAALEYGATYSVTVKGGAGGVADLAGNRLAADVTWSFSTEASPPPILLVGSTANAFGGYLAEILRNEGLNAFTTVDVSFLSPSLLAGFDVVVLGETALTATQVTVLSDWVSGGGNLVAMRPDKQLASLLGLTDAGTTLANAYLRVDTGQAAGGGIVGETIQFHGVADRYSLNGATAIATLYSNASTATANPAVTLRGVGTSGGQAAAFAYDLARSVVYTRQGNPAWAGQERDGVVGIRPNDMFFGAATGDVQPDWLDTNKIAIPQADEQQRLLVNLITLMVRDRLPMPRFWYLPRGEKAVVVMSGDDHAPVGTSGGTVSHLDRYKALSPAGCAVAAWECVRSTVYIYPENPLTNAQAAAYLAEGFEISLHLVVASCPTTAISEAELGTYFDNQLAQFRAKYTSVPSPATVRNHCVYWPGWVSSPNVELARGIRLDANYYHYPQSWIGARPGFMNGGGFPMRFAKTDGTIVDVYQENTNMVDEAGQLYPATVDALLNKAIGPEGYYGAFGANMHADFSAPHSGAEAIVASAQARGVPIISYKQLLDWVDGRNASTIRGVSWSSGALTFVTTVAPGANGLQTLLPVQGPSGGALTALTRDGSPVAYTVETIKGIQYAVFAAASATFIATYS